MWNSKQKKRIWIITLSCLYEIIFILLIFYIFQLAIQRNISNYRDMQGLLADSMLNRTLPQTADGSNDLTEKLISEIKDNFPTSSSVYCVLVKNDSVVFYKDDNTTSSLIEDSISNYFHNNVSSRDKKRYILSQSELEYQGDKYSLMICTKEDYYLKKVKLVEIRLYCMGFFFLFGAAMIVLLIYHLYKLKGEEKNNVLFKNEIRKNRQLIELLEDDRNKHYVNSEKEFSFYNRSVVEEVISQMTEEDMKRCIQIDITVENPKMEHFIFITAILGRIKGDNSIASYWEKNTFKVLLLHSDKQEAMDFINLFIGKYKTESEEKVEELKVVASRLSVS